MRPDERRISGSALGAAALLGALLFSSDAGAGLRFQPATAPTGADVSSLSGDGSTLWAGSSRGVWKLTNGLWTLDGLGERTIASIAVSGGIVWAATGDALFSRAVNGTWIPEQLPSPNAFPSVLLADSSTLYAGGVGVYKRTGGAWTTLPSPGFGLVVAAVIYNNDLVVGLSSGGAARFSGGSWTTWQGGLSTEEGITAFTVAGGTLFGGTGRGAYVWNGSSWVGDAAFGTHDVRALSFAGGTLRAATYDAGVRRKNGTGWSAENAGLLTFHTRSFGMLGSDLYLGTAGGPVYHSSGAAWNEAGPGTLNASFISGVVQDAAFSAPSVSTRGGGLLFSSRPNAPAVPDGCGDIRSLSPSAQPASADLLLAAECGVLTGGASWVSAQSGLPAGTLVTTLAPTDQGILGGTANAGLFRFVGSAWSRDNTGLSDGAAIRTVRRVGTRLYAATGGILSERNSSGVWSDVSSGLPRGAVVNALGGGDPSFAGLAAGGVYRRDGGSPWRKDSAGLDIYSVFSLDVSGARLFAAAGTGGVLMKEEGAFAPESYGLPEGADVRLVRRVASGNPLRDLVFAGTSGHGLFSAEATPVVRTIPVVLDVVGGTGARFRSELTLGSRQNASLEVTFTPAPGFGLGSFTGGTVPLTLAANTELRFADALEFLRSKGLAVPVATPSNPVAGSLTIKAVPSSGGPLAKTDDVYAIARTTTRDTSGGTYGLFYDAVSDIDAAENEATVYALRSIAGVSRSNLAVVHLPGRSSEPITLNVQIYSASGEAAGTPLSKALTPGEWFQFNGVLGQAGLPEGSFGYARITRVSGTGAWSAYGIVNDAVTSDGSFLRAYRPGGLASARRLIVPVVLDVYGAAGSHFTTELTLANDSTIATPVDLKYQPAPGFGEAPGLSVVTLQLGAHAQLTIPNVIQFLREKGVNVPDPAVSGAQAGALFVDFRFLTNLDTPKTVALARTFTPNPNSSVGGTFGLFYEGVARGGGARTSAIVPALAQNESVRSNLAVVHTRGGSDLPLGLSVQLYDAASGVAVGRPLTVTLNPGDWYQWSRVLEAAGVSTTSQAVAVITRTLGDDTFFAYGVLNDSITSDGSFLKMIAADRY